MEPTQENAELLTWLMYENPVYDEVNKYKLFAWASLGDTLDPMNDSLVLDTLKKLSNLNSEQVTLFYPYMTTPESEAYLIKLSDAKPNFIYRLSSTTPKMITLTFKCKGCKHILHIRLSLSDFQHMGKANVDSRKSLSQIYIDNTMSLIQKLKI